MGREAATHYSLGGPNITGFTLGSRGQLTPIPGSTRPLSGDSNSGCAQVSFTPDGKVLIVTERTSSAGGLNRGVIDTYTVNRDGTVNGPILNAPTGIGPFGFNLTLDGFLLTTENFGGITGPGQGHAAPYDVLRNGRLRATGPSEPNFGTDTCWLVVTNTGGSRGKDDDDDEDEDDEGDRNRNRSEGKGHGQFAYVTNFFSSSISSYTVTPDGALVLLEAVADGTIGVGASDQALSQNSRYLYARNSLLGTLEAYRVERHGGLTKIQTITGLPPNGIGLAAR